MSDTTRVELPPGCGGLDLPDGSVARPDELGGAVEIPTRYATAGLVSALGLARVGIGFAHAPMGPASAVCGTCGFHRFVWSDRPDTCPRCGRIEPLEIAS